jgi:hypothetical protein
MQMREVDDRPHPGEARRNVQYVLQASDLADPAHDLNPERDVAALFLESLAQIGELLDHLGERLLARAP